MGRRDKRDLSRKENKMTKTILTAAIAALAALTLTGTVQAQSAMSHDKMSGSMMHSKMGHDMMHGKKMVAYCAECKMYYSKSDAKKMGMKDSMGHKMTMVSMSKVPKGTMMGHMGGSKMMDHKM